MPEVIRNRFREPEAPREPDGQDAPRTRPGFGPDEDPLAELARIVGDTAPSARPTLTAQPSVRSDAQPSPARSASGSQAAAPARDYPRRDTSWRDPHARTIVRASLTPQTMPGQLHDLEADLLNEIRSENIRTLPPAPDLADLGLPDARLPQYPASGRGSPPSARPATQSRTSVATPITASAARQREDLDDEVTVPMQAQLRATPPSARASEDLRMQQPRYAQAPVEPISDPNSGFDAYGYPTHHAVPEAYDPAGALGEGYYEEAEAEYTPDHSGGHGDVPGHLSDAGGHDYPPISAHYGDESAGHYGVTGAYDDDDVAGYAEVPLGSRRPASARRTNTFMIAMVSVVGVLVLTAGGVFTWRAIASSGLTGTNAPLIKADTKPMKEMVAQAPLGAPGPNLDAARSDSQDKLVTQTEDPVDQIPGKPPVRVVGTGAAQDPTLPVMRRVRSVIVRPDGTIVSPDDAAKPAPAASPTQTASLPNAQTTPVPAPQPPAQATPAPQAATPPASSAPLPPITGVTHIDNVPVVAKPNPAPPVAAKPVVPAPQAPQAQAPQPKPVKPAIAAVQPTLAPHAAAGDTNAPLALGPSSGAAPVRVASAPTPPAAQAPRAPVGDAGTSEYMVQISSHTSDAEAKHALASAEQKYASLGIKGGDVQQAEVPGRGTYFRTRLAGGSHDQALALCHQIKAQGGDCVVAKR